MDKKLYRYDHDFRLAGLGDLLISLSELPLYAFRARDGWITVDRSGAQETDSEQLAEHCRVTGYDFVLLWDGQESARTKFSDRIKAKK